MRGEVPEATGPEAIVLDDAGPVQIPDLETSAAAEPSPRPDPDGTDGDGTGADDGFDPDDPSNW